MNRALNTTTKNQDSGTLKNGTAHLHPHTGIEAWNGSMICIDMLWHVWEYIVRYEANHRLTGPYDQQARSEDITKTASEKLQPQPN